MEHYAFQNALAEIFKVIGRANKYIDENTPWTLAKDMEANGARLARVMYNLLEAAAHLRYPAHPLHPRELLPRCFGQIGACETCSTWESAAGYGAPCLRPSPSPRARTCSPASMQKRPCPSWRTLRRRPRRQLCPPWRWSLSSRRRWTLTPSASPISGPLRSRPAKR